ncbi:MAG: YncE family protein [Tannerella sp.]|nr:YncE family protein [Tannerella sp.]
MKRGLVLSAWFAFVAAGFVACRDETEIFTPEEVEVSAPEQTVIQGFYLLNEGNMGSNKSTLDYYDCETGVYRRNIYADANPSVPKELGDVGNDIAIYGSKLYAVINCSNKVEVMEAATARRLGQVDIPNCRYIRFHEGYAYVTSYAGPVKLDPEYEQRGYVAKIDTATFQVVDRCLVGFQPDELEIVGNKIYVANSGGYMFPNYESTVSVIDLASFTETKRIEVARNLHRLQADRHGNLWVTSRGDYYTQPSRLYRVDTGSDELVDSLDIAVSNFYLDGDSLYLYSVEWSYVAMESVTTYGIVDVARREVVSRSFITDGTEQQIRIPYGILVHPGTKDIYVTDAKNYVSPGTLYCFDKDGKQKWNVRTGDIPAHFVLMVND